MPKSKKTIYFFLAVSLLIILLGVYAKRTDRQNQTQLQSQIPEAKLSENYVLIGDTKVIVEIADTPEKQQKGLSGRKSLPEDQGMLFVFNPPDTRVSFWMKGMLIPLDFIWINDSEVVQFHENIPPPEPNTPDSELTLITPDVPVDSVLEVNAGFVEKNDIEVGVSIDINQIK